MSWPPGALIVIVGATASGKSSLAEALARHHGAELVSADALQVYRGLEIGTAKPSAEIREELRYHGLDLFDPRARCTAGHYARWARTCVRQISARQRPAILVGGSGFYIRATLEPLDAMPPSDPRWRAALSVLLDRRGSAEMYRWLRRLDPDRAVGVQPADRQRLLRALEVVLRTGQTMAGQPPPPDDLPPPQPLAWIGLRWRRERLAARIEERVDRMLAAGWLDEVRQLLDHGVPADAHALQAIGYRELVAHLRGELPLADARDQILRATRRYAKRQMTWLRREKSVRWIDLPVPGGAAALIEAAENEVRGAARC